MAGYKITPSATLPEFAVEQPNAETVTQTIEEQSSLVSKLNDYAPFIMLGSLFIFKRPILWVLTAGSLIYLSAKNKSINSTPL